MKVLHEELSKDHHTLTKTYELIVELVKRRLFRSERYRVRVKVTSYLERSIGQVHVWSTEHLRWNLIHELSEGQTSTPRHLFHIDCTYHAFFADVHLLINIAKRTLGMWSEMLDGQLERRDEI